MKKSEIFLRDPFILPYENKYYMYGTRSHTCWGEKATGFDVYVSDDLKNWSEPYEVFHAPEGFWAFMNFWAPEVHVYEGAFYMFATFFDKKRRGTQILKADSRFGPFKVHSPEPVTPKDWICLDGTLYIDEKNDPFMIFAHEWVQIKDGAFAYIPLKKDLSGAAGEAEVMFTASAAPWSAPLVNFPDCYVTDGPFMYRCKNGALLMLWATVGEKGYVQGYAVSESGGIKGPWRQIEKPLYTDDSGHGMLFKGFDEQLYLTLHSPNVKYTEHPVIIPVKEKNAGIEIILTNTG